MKIEIPSNPENQPSEQLEQQRVFPASAVMVENVTSETMANTNMDGLNMADERTPVERLTEVAREQATQAADALRRGEFLHDATVDPEANSDDRLVAMLCYATQVIIPVLLPAIVLMSESSKLRPFQRYHAMQSLALSAVFVALSIIVGIGTAILQIVPLVGFLALIVVGCFTPIALAMGACAMLYYGYQAYKGKRFGIPGLTSFLRDQKWL
jgi:uncharacterized membrane protein